MEEEEKKTSSKEMVGTFYSFFILLSRVRSSVDTTYIKQRNTRFN
jgi:hypothetical protein